MATIDELRERYLAALHAVQTGIEYKRQYDRSFVNEKHMRVGVDSAHITDAAIQRLLIAKGIITYEELMEVLVIEAEAEQARYEAELSAHYGRPVRLG